MGGMASLNAQEGIPHVPNHMPPPPPPPPATLSPPSRAQVAIPAPPPVAPRRTGALYYIQVQEGTDGTDTFGSEQ